MKKMKPWIQTKTRTRDVGPHRPLLYLSLLNGDIVTIIRLYYELIIRSNLSLINVNKDKLR